MYISHSLSRILTVFLGISILFIGAQIYIPLTPVPITLHPIPAMTIGLLFPKKEGLYSVVLYTILGILGLPIFSGYNSGILYFLGPTGGYIIGFIACVYVVSTLKEKYEMHNFWLLICGIIPVYFCGILWLTRLIGIKAAFMSGVVPFIIPGIIKIILLSIIVKFIKR